MDSNLNKINSKIQQQLFQIEARFNLLRVPLNLQLYLSYICLFSHLQQKQDGY